MAIVSGLVCEGGAEFINWRCRRQIELEGVSSVSRLTPLLCTETTDAGCVEEAANVQIRYYGTRRIEINQQGRFNVFPASRGI